MPHLSDFSRREFLQRLAAGATAACAAGCGPARRPVLAADAREPVRSVAGLATIYFRGSHADVIFGKILDGWDQDGGPGPRLRLASLYIHQFHGQRIRQDIGRAIAAYHGVPLFDNIEDAITLGTSRVRVDGVLSVAEHGVYRINDKGQKLHPRRRFLAETCQTFEKFGRVVPVFNDKHLGPVWEDARWMYDRARQLNVPFMAGSSLPVSFRSPDQPLAMGCRLESAVAVGYSGLDSYGFHTLEFLQAHVERRVNAETGIRSVEAVRGKEMWRDVERGTLQRRLLEAALKLVAPGDVDAAKKLQRQEFTLFRYTYEDGLKAHVFMLHGFAAGCSVAVKQVGDDEIYATRAEERPLPRYPHFAYLLHSIERMIYSGRPSFPVERTLLTSGMLDRALTSLHAGGQHLETPELAIPYTPVDYPYAPNPRLPTAADSEYRGAKTKSGG